MFNFVNNNLKEESFNLPLNKFKANNEDNDLFFNIAMQIAKGESEEFSKNFCNNHGHTFLFFSKDSTIRQQYGLQLKTHLGTIKFYRDLFPVIKKLTTDATNAGFKGHEAKKCHFVVSLRKDNFITPTLLRKIDLFMINNYDYFKKLSRRNNNYSIENEKMHDQLGINGNNRNAILYTEQDIIFKFFRSTLKPETILSTIEICHSIVHFLKDNNITCDELYDNNRELINRYKNFILGYEYLPSYASRFN